MSLWVKIGSGRFYSNSDGTERKQALDIQNWGLQVRQIEFAAVVTGRSSASALLRVYNAEGATGDVNALLATADFIASTAVSGALPRSMKGIPVVTSWPFFQPTVGVASGIGATEGYIDVDFYAGGKQY